VFPDRLGSCWNAAVGEMEGASPLNSAIASVCDAAEALESGRRMPLPVFPLNVLMLFILFLIMLLLIFDLLVKYFLY
jgi:hypothetical protein